MPSSGRSFDHRRARGRARFQSAARGDNEWAVKGDVAAVLFSSVATADISYRLSSSDRHIDRCSPIRFLVVRAVFSSDRRQTRRFDKVSQVCLGIMKVEEK